MIISLNWLGQFTNPDLPPRQLAELIGSRLVEVEKVIDLGRRYRGATLVRVKRVLPHPNADKLRLAHVDPGAGDFQGVSRLEDGSVEVICGAANLRQGMEAVWLPPGAAVPADYGKTLETLAAKEVRGVISYGMLASARELALGDDHSGIVEAESGRPAGTSFAAAYQLDDYLLDIDNKSLTHRPDCFGLIGFAREVAAISGHDFKTPDWLKALKPVLAAIDAKVELLPLRAAVAETGLSQRYQLVALEGVDAAKASPLIIQSWLARVGIRPISAAVDVTNYLMYLTGQPLHAFDLDKLLAEHPKHKPEVAVRRARRGEKLRLLDGGEIDLDGQDIVICAGPKPVALAGIMGGASTMVDTGTRRLLLESATFDLYRLRNSQMRHGIFSEAATRFTKGLPAAQTAPVLASAVRMLSEICGARRISEVVDIYPEPAPVAPIGLDIYKLNAVLGTDFNAVQAAVVLKRAEIGTSRSHDRLTVEPPFWRADLHIAEDVIEEIGRLTGYDNIPARLPLRPMAAVAAEPAADTARQLRLVLLRAGANEVLTYSFVPANLLLAAGQKPELAYRISNALSGDLQYYRLSLTPSLLDKCRQNLRAGYGRFALFEIGKTHQRAPAGGDGLPDEHPVLALIHARPGPASQAPYYFVRRFAEYIAWSLKLRFEFRPFQADQSDQRLAPFMPERSAAIYLSGSETLLGVAGEFRSGVLRDLKLPPGVAGLEISLEALSALPRPASDYRPAGKYPGTEKDITLKVPSELPYADIASMVEDSLSSETLEAAFRPLDIYQNPADPSKKNVTLRLELADRRHTLTTAEANGVIARLAEAAAKRLGAEQV